MRRKLSASGALMGISARKGEPIKARDLIALLQSANPEALVYIDAPWGRLHAARLDVLPPGMDYKPCVILETE